MRIKRAATVEDLKEQLDVIVSKPHKASLVVDLKSVALTDTATVQLLICFAGALKSAGTEPKWQNVSDDLVSTAGMIGLGESLGWSA